jgi:hypothetical protein
VFVSADNGAKWQPLQLNLPITPVTDIKVYRKDLVLSTMGRGFWILDDIAPLHDLARPQPAPKPGVHLLQPRAAVRARWAPMGTQPDEPSYPAAAAYIDYVVTDPAAKPTIEIADPAGKLVRTFSPVPSRGLNRLAWDLRAASGSEADPRRGRGGVLVPPGRYEVRLTVAGQTQRQPLEVKADPRLALDGITTAQLQEQYTFNTRLLETIARARNLAATIEETMKAAAPARQTALGALHAQLVTAGGSYPQPMLIDQLQNVLRMTSQADQRVGREAFTRLDDLERELKQIETAFAKTR